MLRALTGKSSGIEWLHDYRQTSKPEDATHFPPFDEILNTLDELHAIALHNIKSISEIDMEKINNVQDDFVGQTIKRQVIYNAIQHEPMHCGQLSWLMKLHGLKTI